MAEDMRADIPVTLANQHAEGPKGLFDRRSQKFLLASAERLPFLISNRLKPLKR